MLKTDDAKSVARFREQSVKLSDELRLAPRLEELEILAAALRRQQGSGTDSDWKAYGSDLPEQLLGDALQDWWLDAAKCLTDAQTHAHVVPTMHDRSGSKTKHNWSPDFVATKKLYHEALRVVTVIDCNKCGHDTRAALLQLIYRRFSDAGRKGTLPNFPPGSHPTGRLVQCWVADARAALATLLREIHGKKRAEMRVNVSEWHAKSLASIALGKWKGLFRSELKRSFSSQNKHVIVQDTFDPDTGEPTGKEVLSEPPRVLDACRSFFAKWMGVCQAKWFRKRRGQPDHILHRSDDEGTAARRALVRGTLTAPQLTEICDGLPEGCDQILHWWRRKTIDPADGADPRPIDESDWDGIDLHAISSEEWIHCVGKSKGNKAADANDMHINLLKALLPPKSRKGDVPDREAEHANAKCSELLDHLRRALVVILDTGVIPDCQLEQILCTIGKVEGSNELKDSRPLTLVSITLNMAVGLQMDKVMQHLDGLQAIDDWQAGFRARTGTEEPLLETRLVAEHCWQYRTDLWAGDEDKRRAFDSPPEASCEMSMDRFAIPYRFILLIKRLGNKARIRVRTAHGLTEYFSKNQGFPQGGRHSPHLWTIFDDPLCTAMHDECCNDGGDPAVVSVPFARPVKLTGKSFADDKRFLASSHAGLQRRFDLSAIWNLMNDIETNVSKSAASAMAHAGPGKLHPTANLPDITMMNWSTGCRETVTMYDPDEPLKSLGMLTTLALSDGYAADEAKTKADRVGVCVAKGSAPAELWTKLLSQVAKRSALYCVHTTSLGPTDLAGIHSRCFRAFKAKAGLCVTTPNEVVSALVDLDWGSQHFIEQVIMVLKYLQRPCSTLEQLLCSAIQHHALWQGGDSTLGAKAPVTRGWDSTLLGRLHLWMATMNLELKGPVATPVGRHGDALLRTLATEQTARDLLASGSWIVEAWRISDCVCWDGAVVASLEPDGIWQRSIDKVTPGLGAPWVTLVSSLLKTWLLTNELGHRARGAIRLGAYVCFPPEQGDPILGLAQLAVGRVTMDHRSEGDWDDKVTIKMLHSLPYEDDDDTLLPGRLWSRLALTVPRARCALEQTSHHLRGGGARGSLYAASDRGLTMTASASSLLEVKMVELPLRKPIMVGLVHTEQLLQLDEDLTPPDALDTWSDGRVELATPEPSFDFPDREDVIGREHAGSRGWATDPDEWERQLATASDRHCLDNRRTVLLMISDGSVKGEGFAASSTYGWASYGIELPGLSVGCPSRFVDSAAGFTLSGGGRVAGPPEWTSSTRAEAVGLLAALMGAMTAGWKGDIDLRLDNDSAVGRAGGLVQDYASDFCTDEGDDGAPEQVLRDAMQVENSDVWTEYVAWRDAHRATGSRVTVSWHPGHPERRKSSTGTDWNRIDHAIFLADEIAEQMHSLPTPSRTPTHWSHRPAWTLSWRGTVQHGCIAKRLHDAVRTELLAAYMQSTGLGPGTDTDWVIPELTARTIAVKEGGLAQRCHKAKMVASILGTKHTQHRRGGLDDGDDPMCRTCGQHLETDNHVIWECTHIPLVRARQALSKRVKAAWRRSGLGLRELAVAQLLWVLNADGSVLCTGDDHIRQLLGADEATCAGLLAASLLGHTLDTTGIATERNGLFGRGWVTLLGSLGMDRPDALNALVEVANELHGPKGTFAIWKAFTESLEENHCSTADDPTDPTGAADPQYLEWLLDVRTELRSQAVEDDEPFRTLSAMTASGMTSDDRLEFQDLVTSWIVQNDIMDPDRFGWATSLADAVLMARAHVWDSRQQRGRRMIKVRDLARADAKLVAAERRAKRHKGGTGPGPTGLANDTARRGRPSNLLHRPTKPKGVTRSRADDEQADPAPKRLNTAVTTTTGKRRPAPAGGEDNSKRPNRKSKADKRKPDALSTAQANTKRQNHATKADKHDAGSSPDGLPTAKRLNQSSKVDKRKLGVDSLLTDRSKRAYRRSTAGSRYREDSSQGRDNDTDKRRDTKAKADKRGPRPEEDAHTNDGRAKRAYKRPTAGTRGREDSTAPEQDGNTKKTKTRESAAPGTSEQEPD
jgi:hypothetical protein